MKMKRRVLGGGETNYYHVVSRVVDRRVVFGTEEKRYFRALMERLLRFSGLRCVTFCLMGNHFHLLLEVSDAEGAQFRETATAKEIFARLSEIYPEEVVREIREDYACAGEDGREAILERFLDRMYDLSTFVKELKFGFSRWFNGRNDRVGTLWESRFKSVLLEGAGEVLRVIAAYIDLNPVRAGMVDDPKDYRWSGYGEAVAGVEQSRAGISRALGRGFEGWEHRWPETQASYRMLLYDTGRSATGEKHRLDPAAVEAVVRAGGTLTVAEVLRCRVRYFSDGFAIGTAEFLRQVFKEQRHHFSKGRKQADIEMRGALWGLLRAMRDLQKNPVGKGDGEGASES